MPDVSAAADPLSTTEGGLVPVEPAGRVAFAFEPWIRIHPGGDQAVRDAVRGLRAGPEPAGGARA